MIKLNFRFIVCPVQQTHMSSLIIARGELLRMYSLVNLNILQVLEEWSLPKDMEGMAR